MTRIDGAALGLYCASFARWREANEELARQGVLVMTANGGAKINPLLTVANQAQANMAKILAEFGGSPSSRSRLKADQPAPEDDLTKFLNRRPK